MKALSAAIAASCAIFVAHDAHAQQYPTKPVRLIVPLAPGGGNDTIARLIGQKISPTLGQQVVVDNRAGAGGLIAAELVSKSPPDGYTLLLGNVAVMTIIPNSQKKVPYDSLKDFQPVSLIASAPLLVVVHPSLPVSSIKQLIALAKAKPNQINYASNGVGSSTHLATEMFAMMADVKMTHVPYKGTAPALQDLIGGQIQVMMDTPSSMLPHVRGGKIKVLGMASEKRIAAAPDIPTLTETGVPVVGGTWVGWLAPAGTPKAAVDKLSGDIQAIFKRQDIRDRLIQMGIDPVGNSPAEFDKFLREEVAKWGKVIKQAGVRIEG